MEFRRAPSSRGQSAQRVIETDGVAATDPHRVQCDRRVIKSMFKDVAFKNSRLEVCHQFCANLTPVSLVTLTQVEMQPIKTISKCFHFIFMFVGLVAVETVTKSTSLKNEAGGVNSPGPY